MEKHRWTNSGATPDARRRGVFARVNLLFSAPGGSEGPSTLPVGRFDDRTWTVATRSAPVVIQVILGLLLVSTWLLGRWSLLGDAAHAPRLAVLGATGIAVVLSLGVGVGLLGRDSTKAKGFGLSTAACAAIVLIGAVTYAFWLL